MNKPLGIKAYGSISHLSTSRLGPGDHRVHIGQEDILTRKARDKRDLIIVEQKIDGSCVAVAKLDDGACVALGRAGHTADSSPYEQHRLFARWMREHYERFDAMLEPGERAVGEWLAQAHGTRYELPHDPFVLFDIMRGYERTTHDDLDERALIHGFVRPQRVWLGGPMEINDAMSLVIPEAHGAIDPVEGIVYRCERDGRVDFMAKHVRDDYVPGRYLPEISKQPEVWNWTFSNTSPR